jgi:ATP-dependent DNA helicase RecG
VRAIEYLKLKNSITNKEYQSLFDITDRTALRDLNDLVTKGLVQKKGAKKGTRYLLHHVG